MKFKVGDRVKIISEDAVDAGERRVDGFMVDGLLFNDLMKKYCDNIGHITVTRLADLEEGPQYRYKVDVAVRADKKRWFFSEGMLEAYQPHLDRLKADLKKENEFNEELL